MGWNGNSVRQVTMKMKSVVKVQDVILLTLSLYVEISPTLVTQQQTHGYLPSRTQLPLPLGWYSFPIPLMTGG